MKLNVNRVTRTELEALRDYIAIQAMIQQEIVAQDDELGHNMVKLSLELERATFELRRMGHMAKINKRMIELADDMDITAWGIIEMGDCR